MKKTAITKKIALLLLTAVMGICLMACQQSQLQQEQAPGADQSAAEATPQPTPDLPAIALVVTGEDSFNAALAEHAQALLEGSGYSLLTFFSDSADGQETDLYTALGKGVKGILLMPVDEDGLEAILVQSEAQKIPVINLLNPVNGIVTMLISPDYQLMGQLACRQFATLMPDGADILTLEEEGAAFLSQMIHDGITSEAANYEHVSIVRSLIVNNDENQAYEQALSALGQSERINAVFAQTEALAQGAIRAAEQSGRDITIVSCGGSQALMGQIEAGKIAASVFMSPVQLAELAVQHVTDAIGGAPVPQYDGLQLEVITPDTVAKYKETGSYADVIEPPAPDPTPEPSESPEGAEQSPTAEDETSSAPPEEDTADPTANGGDDTAGT